MTRHALHPWRFLLPIALLVLAGSQLPSAAGLLTKSYEFKAGVTLDIGVEGADQVRLDSVQFRQPDTSGGKVLRTGGLFTADVAVSNLGEVSRKVGIAIALFDDAGRLVGVASGGTRITSVKSQRQRTFRLVFDDVVDEAHTATTFQISIESK